MSRKTPALVGLTLILGACGLEDTSGGEADVCSAGKTWDSSKEACVTDGHNCSAGKHWDSTSEACVADTGTPTCSSGKHWDASSESCVSDGTTPVGDNYCIIEGVDSLTEVGYEVSANASTLGRGTWVNIGSKSGSNAKVRVDLTAPANPVAVRISAKTPSGRYLAENYSSPVANATVKCRIGGSDLTLEPRAVTGYTRGAEMAGSKSGSLPSPITTN